MTKKPISLTGGRLTFPDMIRKPATLESVKYEDDIDLRRERKPSFYHYRTGPFSLKAAYEPHTEEEQQRMLAVFRHWFSDMMIIAICRYNPQRLLEHRK